MFSEKQFQAWRKVGAAIDEAAQTRVRASVEAEVDGALAEIERDNERRAGAQQFRHANRHRDQVTSRHTASTPTPGQEAERRAEIRRQVEREMDAYLLSRRG